MQRAPESEQAIIVENVSFQGGPYRLEAEFAYPETSRPVGAAVFAGPHPLLGGDMHNNVVRGLGDGLAGRGLATLRFNYRGVGNSAGPPIDVAEHLAQFWASGYIPDEMAFAQDVQGAIEQLRGAAGRGLPLALVGYSFGCALLPHLALDGIERPALVLVAPTVGKHDYASYNAVACPVLVIASEDDFATDAGQVRDWFERLAAPARLILRRFDNHFFRGHEAWLAQTVFDFLQGQWR